MKTENNQAFCLYLKKEFARRCNANPSYSLKAYARTLGVEPSALSKILRGQRQITLKSFQRFAERLALTPKEISGFAPPQKLRRKHIPVIATHSEYREFPLDLSEVYGEWQHFAILELTYVKGFRMEAKWIAKALALPVPTIQLALERLTTHGFLGKDKQGRWRDLSGSVSVGNSYYTSAAIQQMQRQVLEKSIEAISQVSIDKRDHSSMTMAIDTRRLPAAKELMKKFRRDLCELLKGDAPPRDQVYHLAISLYPISQIEE